MVEEKKTKAINVKNRRFWIYAGVVVLILAAVIISLLFYKQKIETTNTVFQKLTEDWQTYKSDKYGFSFKYPKSWQVIDGPPTIDRTINYVIIPGLETGKENHIALRILDQRSVDTKDSWDAIQISIPFDKQNYLIFSTSTNSDSKEIFYNIPVTLVVGK